MEFATLLDIAASAAIIIGLVFAAIELRQARIARRRESMFSLLKAYQIPEFWFALEKLFNMPDGLTRKQVEKYFGKDAHLLSLLTSTFESLGILVQRREMDIQIVEDFFSGPLLIAWKKLKRSAEQSRRERRRETLSEYFQWLAERVEEREKRKPPVPAHIAFKNWKSR
jgi:hypothetical protein